MTWSVLALLGIIVFGAGVLFRLIEHFTHLKPYTGGGCITVPVGVVLFAITAEIGPEWLILPAFALAILIAWGMPIWVGCFITEHAPKS